MALPSRRLRRRSNESEPVIDAKARSVDPGLARLSYYLDQVFRVPGTTWRFGIEPILGFLLPGAGDAITTIMSAYIVVASMRFGLPKIVIGRMVFNVAADYLLGSIPLVGDLFDFAFKANQKNLDLLDQYATGERRHASLGDWAWLVILLALLGAIVVGGVILVLSVLAQFNFRLF